MAIDVMPCSLKKEMQSMMACGVSVAIVDCGKIAATLLSSSWSTTATAAADDDEDDDDDEYDDEDDDEDSLRASMMNESASLINILDAYDATEGNELPSSNSNRLR